ncbi:MAG: hypothetical protein ACRCSU_14200 [Paracoccaceae bacterium]
MIVIAGLFLGSIFGGVIARKKGGDRLDIAQYAAVCALIGAMLGMFATIVIERLAG